MPEEYLTLVYEHVLAYAYGWTPDIISNLDYGLAMAHVQMCLVRSGIDREYEAQLAGAKMQKKLLF